MHRHLLRASLDPKPRQDAKKRGHGGRSAGAKLRRHNARDLSLGKLPPKFLQLLIERRDHPGAV